MPKVRRQNLPPPPFTHLLDRIQRREIPAARLGVLAAWLDSEPEVLAGPWYKEFSGTTVRSEAELVKTFLLPQHAARGERVL